jgi:hypothetical protein
VSSKNKIKSTPQESVKLKTDVVNLVRDEKKKTGVAIGRFIEFAIVEKINKNTNG